MGRKKHLAGGGGRVWGRKNDLAGSWGMGIRGGGMRRTNHLAEGGGMGRKNRHAGGLGGGMAKKESSCGRGRHSKSFGCLGAMVV